MRQLWDQHFTCYDSVPIEMQSLSVR